MTSKKKLTLSPTQIATALECERKWYFKKVLKLPEARRVPDPRTLGDVLHEVSARFLEADELATPDAKLLYPKGWTTVVSKFGADKGQPRSVSPGEAALIQNLVSKAIEEGVLVRQPEGRVETRFDIKLAETEKGNIWFMGFRDYVPNRSTVEDHKTCKKDRSPWRKTPEALYKNVQMRAYGYSLIWEAKERGEVPPPEIRFVHNQFCKEPDSPVVRRTETKISREEIEQWWEETVVPKAHRLLEVREAEHWGDIPPPSTPDVCNMYGGCPFMKICTKRVSVERYTRKVNRKNRLPMASHTPEVNSGASNQPTASKGDTMGFAEKLARKKAQRAAAAGGKPAPQPEPKPEPKPTAPETDGYDGAPPEGAPPWADPSCGACKGKGFNSNGNPCRICDVRAKRAGRPQSKEFTIEAEGGVVVWVGADGTEGSMVLSGEPKVKQTEKEVKAEAPEPAPTQEAPASAPEPEPEPKPKQLEVEVVEIADDAPETPAKEKIKPKKRGRPKKGFTLLIDAAPTRGARGVMWLDAMLQRYGAKLAEEANASSFFELNPFERRDALMAQAANMAAEVGSGMLVAQSGNVLQREMLSVLAPMASSVIRGIR